MRIPFRLVDVFTDRPLAGNQLCVVPEPVQAPTELMQAVAREIGFSETTFVTQIAPDRYAMRIFTPTQEIPFAGHPSLGTAFVLVSEGRVSSPVTQSVPAGESEIVVDPAAGVARMLQLPPSFGAEAQDGEALAGALGLRTEDLHPELPAQLVSTGLPVLIVPARDRDAVVRAMPETNRLAPLLAPLGTDGCYLFAAEGAGVKARYFTSDAGTGEDAATGSAAGPLGAYLSERGVAPGGRLTIEQGEEIGRPSTLVVDVELDAEAGRWQVFVGGGVVQVAEGWFDLPD